jgi:hypothetical protein
MILAVAALVCACIHCLALPSVDPCQRVGEVGLTTSIQFAANEPFQLSMDESHRGPVILQTTVRVACGEHADIFASIGTRISDVRLQNAVSAGRSEAGLTVAVDGRSISNRTPACIVLEITLHLPQKIEGLAIDACADVLFDRTNSYIKKIDVSITNGTVIMEHARGLHARDVSIDTARGNIHLLDTYLTASQVDMRTSEGALLMDDSQVFAREVVMQTKHGALTGSFSGPPDLNVSLTTTTGIIKADAFVADPGYSHKQHLAYLSAQSRDGFIDLQTNIATPMHLIADSDKGDVRVTLRGNQGGRYVLETEHGNVFVEVPAQITMLHHAMQGTFGDGDDSFVKLVSVLGDLLLRILGERAPIAPPHEPQGDPTTLWMIGMSVLIAVAVVALAGLATYLLKSDHHLLGPLTDALKRILHRLPGRRDRQGRQRTRDQSPHTPSERQRLLEAQQ